jgi:hypothetical protein
MTPHSNATGRMSAARGRRHVADRLRKAAWASAAVATYLGTPTPGHAQVSTDISRAPTLTIERYGEDWSKLADPEKRTGHWTERFKFIPLSDSGSIYLSTGLEARSRYEGYENVNWGSAPDDDYVWHRLMPYADLHVGKVRFFAQPILSAISGAGRAKRPVDTTGIDMLQAFGEVELDIARDTKVRLSVGRKLVSLGAGRFIDTRYGPGVPQPFDGIEAVVQGRTRQVTAMYLEPVDTRPGDLDDRRSRDKAVWGLYATQWLGGTHSGGLDIYYLGLRDRQAVFDQGTGREVVHTFGTRLFGDKGAWFWNVEGAFQRGTFGGDPVSTWGAGGEIGHRFLQAPLQPTIGLTTDIVSGDGDPDDRKLGTFNPLFPRGKYFGALTPIGPRNLVHVRPTGTIHPRRDMAVALSGVAYWRKSTHDGIYAIPGLLLRSGSDSDASFIGKQIELVAAWQATPELNLSASLSAFVPGSFIRDTGPSRTIRMAGAMATFRF